MAGPNWSRVSMWVDLATHVLSDGFTRPGRGAKAAGTVTAEGSAVAGYAYPA
jgi:hypothetical protein